jgi:putative oxidoreductase
VTAYLVPVARLLFSLIFYWFAPGNFSEAAVNRGAQQGVPLAGLVVPLSGVIALVGAASVTLGYRARIGALLLLVFLLPVTFTMHRFWAAPAAAYQGQLGNFLRNLALVGGARLVCHFGAGPFSLDTRLRER